MTTTFALLCGRCGLSQREAADVLGMRPDTIKSLCTGRRAVPVGAVAELRALYAKIERAAAEVLAQIDEIQKQMGDDAPEAIEIGLAADDHEARSREIGMPCVGAHAAVLGIVAARSPLPVIIVPRGSTPATAAAADAHEVRNHIPGVRPR